MHVFFMVPFVLFLAIGFSPESRAKECRPGHSLICPEGKSRLTGRPCRSACKPGQDSAKACLTSIPAAGHSTISCRNIIYHVYMPAGCRAGGCGMIFDVPGRYMKASTQAANTRIPSIGNARGYIVVVPEAPDYDWTDDLYPLVAGFMREARDRWDADRDRLHLTGFSQGGAMSWYFACRHSDLVASVAPLSYHSRSWCTAADFQNGPVSILYAHGHEDGIVPWEEGTPASVNRVLQGTPHEKTSAHVVSSDNLHTRTRYTTVRGATFDFLEHDYTDGLSRGHCIFGSTESGWFSCNQNVDQSWGEMAVEFFADHPRP